MRIIWLSILFALCVVLGIAQALARDNGQWENTDPVIRQWYRALMQPDNPVMSCCGEADAYWADSYEVSKDGEYIAIITDTREDALLGRQHRDVGTRIVVPNAKLKWGPTDPQSRIEINPTGHGIIFLSRGDYVYCYVAPGGV